MTAQMQIAEQMYSLSVQTMEARVEAVDKARRRPRCFFVNNIANNIRITTMHSLWMEQRPAHHRVLQEARLVRSWSLQAAKSSPRNSSLLASTFCGATYTIMVFRRPIISYGSCNSSNPPQLASHVAQCTSQGTLSRSVEFSTDFDQWLARETFTIVRTVKENLKVESSR